MEWYRYGLTQALNAVRSLDENEIWAVGNLGVVVKSTDGGLNWSIISTGEWAKTDVYFLNSQTGL